MCEFSMRMALAKSPTSLASLGLPEKKLVFHPINPYRLWIGDRDVHTSAQRGKTLTLQCHIQIQLAYGCWHAKRPEESRHVGQQ